jgi:hypothetical protein
MESEYLAQRSRLAEALTPTSVTIDTAEMVLKRSAQTRAEVFALLKELESMQVVFMILTGQVRNATNRAGIPEVEAHIKCLRNMASLFEDSFASAPRRVPLEQELSNAVAQYAGLRTAGSGDLVLSERQRLRALTVQLPVIGAEDTVEHERALRSLHSSIDQMDAELQNLMVATMLSLRLPDDLAPVVANFGIEMMREPEAPALPAEDSSSAALDTPQAPSAPAEGE